MSSSLRKALEERVLIMDGGIGTSLLARVEPGEEQPGTKTCLDLWNCTHPERVLAVHEGFLGAGCDLIETNTFLSSPLALAEYGLEDRAEELNRRAVELAREAARRHATPDKPRWVLGSVGPGLRLPSLGQVDEASLLESHRVQVRALLEAGVDGLVLETCQDLLQIRTGLQVALELREELWLEDVILMVSVTVEMTGRLLSGHDLSEVIAEVSDSPIDLLGLNCATGPREMGRHVRELAASSPHRLAVYPNAGLPQLEGGHVHYPLKPAELALWLTRYVEEDLASVVGGCCGTTPEHLRAVAQAIGRRRAPLHPGGEERSQEAIAGGSRPGEQLPLPAAGSGARTVDSLPLQNVLPFLNEDQLFSLRWGHGRKGRSARERAQHVEQELRPHLHDLVGECGRQGLFQPAAALGFWPVQREGERLFLLEPGREGEAARTLLELQLPRQSGRSALCIADFFAPVDDSVGLFAVTLGDRVHEAIREHFRSGDAVARRELEGLAAELLTALAEHVHGQLRAEWGIGHEDARETPRLLAGGYRGARFAFGSGALPADQQSGVLELLQASSVGIALDDAGRLCPTLSQVFLVSHHADARFFPI